MFFFYVSANINGTEIGSLPIFKYLSDLREVKIRSKLFNNYKDCIDSAQLFTSDIVKNLNDNSAEYFIRTGLNPNFVPDDIELVVPGIGQLGEWHEHELTRFYIINNNCKDEQGVFSTKLIVSVLSQPQHKEN